MDSGSALISASCVGMGCVLFFFTSNSPIMIIIGSIMTLLSFGGAIWTVVLTLLGKDSTTKILNRIDETNKNVSETNKNISETNKNMKESNDKLLEEIKNNNAEIKNNNAEIRELIKIIASK